MPLPFFAPSRNPAKKVRLRRLEQGILLPPPTIGRITGNLGSLVGADFPTPVERNVTVRLNLLGGTHDPTLPTTTVATEGSFALEAVPTGRAYQLAIEWRTGIFDTPVQTITLDRITITGDTTLADLLTWAPVTTTYTLTGELADLIPNADFTKAFARLETTNTPGVNVAGEIRFPVTEIDLATDGTFTLPGVPSSALGVQYRLIVEAASLVAGPNVRLHLGPFNVLGDTHIGLWETVIHDECNAADATPLSGRTMDPGPGVWPSCDAAFTIVGNKAYWPTHGGTQNALWDMPDTVPSTEDRDVRMSAGYDIGTLPNGSATRFKVLMRYNNSGVEQAQYIILEKDDTFAEGGTCTMSIARDGIGPPTLVPEAGQALTGQPTVGTIEVRNVGKVVTVKINGTAIATATSTEALPNNNIGFQWQNRHPKADWVKIDLPIEDPVGGGSEPPPVAQWPTALDGTHEAMRPTTLAALATLTVNTSVSESATNFHTIADALTEAQALQHDAVQQTSLNIEFSTLGTPYGPDYRVDIVIAPGTYDESLGTGGGPVALIGATGNKADIDIRNTTTGAGVLHSFSPVFLDSLTLRSQGAGTVPSGPKYPWHVTSSQGTSVAANCALIEENTGGEGGIGMDGGEGCTLVLYKTTVTGLAVTMNIHGAVGNNQRVQVIVSNCALSGNWSYNELGNVTDEMWDIANTGGTGSAGSGSITYHGSGTPPYPVQGLSDWDQTYFVPSAVRGPFPVTQTFGTGDQAPFTPVANRTYYVPVDPTSAIHRTHAGVVAAAAGGTCTVRTVRRVSPYPTGDTPAGGSTGTLAIGANDVQSNFYDTYYPGEGGHLWVLVKATSGTPSLQGSITQAVGAYYSDDDGATINAVPGGTRVPVVRLYSAT